MRLNGVSVQNCSVPMIAPQNRHIAGCEFRIDKGSLSKSRPTDAQMLAALKQFVGRKWEYIACAHGCLSTRSRPRKPSMVAGCVRSSGREAAER